MLIKQLLDKARSLLSKSGVTSCDLDAELLLCHILNKPRSYLYTWPDRAVNKQDQSNYFALLQRRQQGEPIAYITGQKEFWSLNLSVSTETLIPRPETELLVELALAATPHNKARTVIDLGTGTGAIALAIAAERPQSQLLATDFSEMALAIAQRNAKQLNVSNIEFRLGSWFEVCPNEQFDLIVSNPPYIRWDDPHLRTEDIRFEPITALVSGNDGLDDIRTIVSEASKHLHHHGQLMIEHGYDQGAAVKALMELHGLKDVCIHQDLAGIDRVTSGQKIPSNFGL